MGRQPLGTSRGGGGGRGRGLSLRFQRGSTDADPLVFTEESRPPLRGAVNFFDREDELSGPSQEIPTGIVPAFDNPYTESDNRVTSDGRTPAAGDDFLLTKNPQPRTWVAQRKRRDYQIRK